MDDRADNPNEPVEETPLPDSVIEGPELDNPHGAEELPEPTSITKFGDLSIAYREGYGLDFYNRMKDNKRLLWINHNGAVKLRDLLNDILKDATLIGAEPAV